MLDHVAPPATPSTSQATRHDPKVENLCANVLNKGKKFVADDEHSVLHNRTASQSFSQAHYIHKSGLISFLSTLSVCFRTLAPCPLHPSLARSHCSCLRLKPAVGSVVCGKLSCSTTMWLSRSSPFRYVKSFQSH